MDIFKAYDIRGEYPNELDEETVRKIGACFVPLLKARNIAVGHDMRISSPNLASAFIDGAVSSGASVTDMGMVTTPHFYFEQIEGGFDAGAMITASHLPSEMNGLKLVSRDAVPLSSDQGLPELKQMTREGSCPPAGKALERGNVKQGKELDNYINRISGFVHEPVEMNIVVDGGNGAVGPELELLFKRFPMWNVTTLCMEPDGSFPNHVANPLIPANTEDLQRKVTETKAGVGIAFDGDADRCGFVDENGDRIREDLVTALIAEFFLYRQPGSKILYDLRSSRTVPETIKRLGGVPVRSRVGHSFIKELMRREGAVFAGELSGHYYYKDMGYTDNALLTMVHMLNYLAYKGQPLSEIMEHLQIYSATGEINMTVSDPKAIFAALKQRYRNAGQDCLDGLTVTYNTWWFNLRLSNTEPLMRLNLEAENLMLMNTKRQEVVSIISKADPKMQMEPESR
ncbi:MAG: phosphomannomutase/phosphoglucomutase [Syntrophaceae bacterium]